jgi:hypothetical protein
VKDAGSEGPGKRGREGEIEGENDREGERLKGRKIEMRGERLRPSV